MSYGAGNPDGSGNSYLDAANGGTDVEKKEKKFGKMIDDYAASLKTKAMSSIKKGGVNKSLNKNLF